MILACKKALKNRKVVSLEIRQMLRRNTSSHVDFLISKIEFIYKSSQLHIEYYDIHYPILTFFYFLISPTIFVHDVQAYLDFVWFFNIKN